MKKMLSKKEKARRQSIRLSPAIKEAIRGLDPARILTLDLETTGLTADAEIIQLSIMNGFGQVLLNRYFKPIHTERWDEAMEVNHITPEQVAHEDPFILWADEVSRLFMDADSSSATVPSTISNASMNRASSCPTAISTWTWPRLFLSSTIRKRRPSPMPNCELRRLLWL